MSTPTADILKPLDQIHGLGYTMSTVFREWIRLMLYSLQRRDEPYLEVMGRYDNDRKKGDRPADYFADAMAELMGKMVADKEAGREPREYLGGCYMAIAGKYSVQGMGQYFTPQPVCDMMAAMTIGDTGTDSEAPRVADPACGSGRLLHSAAKQLPTTAHFTGIDLDSICAHMATLNLCFFNMNGVIIHGNALSMKYYSGWITRRTGMGGSIREMSEKEVAEYRELRGEALQAQAEKQVESEPVSTNGSEDAEGSTEQEFEQQLALF